MYVQMVSPVSDHAWFLARELQVPMGAYSEQYGNTLLQIESYTHYSARMSPENTHNLMGFMEILILGVILQYMVSASLSCFL